MQALKGMMGFFGMGTVKYEPIKHLRIVLVSDTHTMLSKVSIPPGDILIHAGDFTFTGAQDEINSFIKDLDELDFKYKIVIPGNHELTLDPKINPIVKKSYFGQKEINHEALWTKLKEACYILNHEAIEIEGIRIFGSPKTPNYGDWAFMYGDSYAKQTWKDVPPCDILITHGPPHKILDFTYDEQNAGCPQLLNKIKQLQPSLHVFGHIHEGYGNLRMGATLFVNASSVNLQYKPINAARTVLMDRITHMIVNIN